jgi:hypothetical protein
MSKRPLFSPTTTSVPKTAYAPSPRTHSCSSAAGRREAAGLSVTNTEPRAGAVGRPLRGRRRLDRLLPDGLSVAGRHAQAVAGEGLRSDGQVVPGRSASWKAH